MLCSTMSVMRAAGGLTAELRWKVRRAAAWCADYRLRAPALSSVYTPLQGAARKIVVTQSEGDESVQRCPGVGAYSNRCAQDRRPIGCHAWARSRNNRLTA